jgi:hypothetical protein
MDDEGVCLKHCRQEALQARRRVRGADGSARLRALYGFVIVCRERCRWAYPRVRGPAAPTTNMGRQQDDPLWRVPPMRSRRARRLLLSALAGSGLTAASLGGPLVSGALGASTAEEAGSPSVPSAPVIAGAGAQESIPGQRPGTTPAKAPAKPSTNTTPSTSSSGTGSTGQGASAQPSSGAVPEAPPVVLQRGQKATTDIVRDTQSQTRKGLVIGPNRRHPSLVAGPAGPPACNA